MAETAKVYLVGAGPGDPGLLTRRAEQLLSEAYAVIYDRLVGPDILALVHPDAKLINAGKQKGQQEEVQAEIYASYLRLRHAPGPIVRLKGGDPMVFGRGGEELEFLDRHGFDVEVVPGVSSVTASAALAGIPITMRGTANSFTVLAGHEQSLEAVDWLVYRHVDTIIVLMGVSNRALIAASLLHAGRRASDAVAFIENASTPSERIIQATLGEVARNKVDVQAPAVMIIGEVVRMRRKQTARMVEASERYSL